MELEIRLSYNSLIHTTRPDIAIFWNNKMFINWAQKTGYQGVEFLPFHGPARDILTKPIEVISKIPEIKSGHVFYNPYATVWNVLSGKDDPLRPESKLAKYNLVMVEPRVGKIVLNRLEKAFGTNFPIITYPYELKDGKRPYGTYNRPWLQTHPAVFNDESSEDDLIRLVKTRNYEGVVWDTFHAMEKASSGKRPLFNWKKSLAKLLEANVIREIHVQAARSTEKYGKVPDRKWARDLTGEHPKYNSEIGQLIRLVKSFGQDIPFVIEISPQGLFDAGILKKSLFLKTGEDLQKIHQQIIDYVKRV